jgi:hypothetical protein
VTKGGIIKQNIFSGISLAYLLLALLGVGCPAQAAEEATELAKKTQNPVADLMSFPFQNNTNLGIGPNHRTQNVLNFQPVIPISLNSEWNLITRTVMPIIKQPDVRTTDDNTWGLGSTTFTAFLSPASDTSFTWGVGPAIQLPTTTDDALGSRKWGAGPSVVALSKQGPWVIGVVANQIWSIGGGNDRPNTSAFLVQPFINYNVHDGWYLTSSPIITADWQATPGNKWTLPVGGGFGKVFFIGKLPFNANLSAFSNVVRPDPGPDVTVRFQIALLLPKSIFTK